MQTVYIGNTLINDVMLGSQRMDDVFQSSQILIQYLIVGGGAAGGAAPGNGIPGSAGGGAGGLISGSLLIPKSNISYTVQVGPKGLATTGAGGGGYPSIFNTTTAFGGGGGGSNMSAGQFNGLQGASGGGGGGTGGSGAASNYPLQGNSGSNSNGSNIAGGGGGAGSVAGTGAFQGGSGSGSIWLDGLEYSIGGGGDGTSYQRYNQGATYGNGGPGGYGNTTGELGFNGVVKVRYAGAPRASGGTISQSGGYTYHTYTYSAGVTSSFTY
jgi:hypothetical protein